MNSPIDGRTIYGISTHTYNVSDVIIDPNDPTCPGYIVAPVLVGGDGPYLGRVESAADGTVNPGGARIYQDGVLNLLAKNDPAYRITIERLMP